MGRITWILHHARPAVELEMVVPGTEQTQRKVLLADTGAGPVDAPFELLLDEDDCLVLAQRVGQLVRLGGAYSGEHRTYVVAVQIPALSFSRPTLVVGVNRPPAGFDGIAAFRFLNRFSYGNFGAHDQFGIELP